jgi:hypothetical protein
VKFGKYSSVTLAEVLSHSVSTRVVCVMKHVLVWGWCVIK